MKGKSLFQLLNELNKAERHQLLNVCKRSGDKRHSALYQLAKRSNGAKDSFEDLLDQCARPLYGSKNEKEIDKTQRRFIDFSLKEIEQIKLKNFLGEDLLLRNFLLSRIYEGKGDASIESRYLERTGELAEKAGDRFMTDYFIDRMVDLTSRAYTKKDMQKLRVLLIRKNSLIQKSYHSELARIYELLSVLNLEDTTLMEGLKSLVLKEEEVDVLVSLAAGSSEAAAYLIARSRFAFFDQELFQKSATQAQHAIKKLKDPTEKNNLQKKLDLLRCQHRFHFGAGSEELLDTARLLAETNSGMERFYYHLFRILAAHEKKKPLPDSKEIQKLKMEVENEFRREFLVALLNFLNGDYGPALKRINQLSYVSNFQISAWSRLIEFRIHLNKGNISLCESLSGRINRHFSANKGKAFTLNSGTGLFQQLNDELKGKSRSKGRKQIQAITCLHSAIMQARTV